MMLPKHCNNDHFDNDDDDIASAHGRLELKILTSTAGVIRNITHSTRSNCEKLHRFGLTDLFIWRLSTIPLHCTGLFHNQIDADTPDTIT